MDEGKTFLKRLGKPLSLGGLQPMGSQRVGYDWVTEHSTQGSP